MTTEDDDMHKPSWLTNNINLGNVITLVTLLVAGTAGYARLEGRVETIEQFRVETVRNMDDKFAAITRSLEGLPNLAYRVTANEEALKATNMRVDASLQNISQRLAEINQALGALDTKVAVLTQRLELMPPGRRSELTLRPAEVAR